MKSWPAVLGCTIVLFTLSCGCEGGGKEKSLQQKLLGKWRDDSGQFKAVVSYFANGTTTIVNDGGILGMVTIPGTYTVTDDRHIHQVNDTVLGRKEMDYEITFVDENHFVRKTLTRGRPESQGSSFTKIGI